MTQITKDLVSWLKQWFYEESEVDNLLSTKLEAGDVSFGFDSTNEQLYLEVD